MKSKDSVSSRRQFFGALGLGAAASTVSASPAAAAVTAGESRNSAWFNVREFGARGTGARLDTQFLQAAIDACAAAGGGTVFFPAGNYLTGTLILKSRVALHLDAGATLLGSRNLDDYSRTIPRLRSYTDNYTERSLIYAENLEAIAIEGRGIIDGQGAAFKGPYKVRPYLIRMIGCRGVSVRDITLKDSPMWVQHYLACDDVQLDGLTVRSNCNANNDGIDIDGCQRVRIANCDIRSGDDAIVLKSTMDRLCKDVVVTNCILSSDCNAFKLGTESNGGFENIALSNCTMYDTQLAGIALELVDGGLLNQVSISNVVMRDVRGAIFIRLGNRARPFKEGLARIGVGRLQNISISDVQASGADKYGCSITGLPGHPAAAISLDNVRVNFAGGGTAEDARRSVPEHPEKYPEYKMFAVLPAYGFYCRHARGLNLRNIQVDFERPDSRPALVCDDVRDLELQGFQAALPSAPAPIVRFQNVRNAFVHGCRCPQGAAVLLQAAGKPSPEIRLQANDVPKPIEEVRWEG